MTSVIDDRSMQKSGHQKLDLDQEGVNEITKKNIWINVCIVWMNDVMGDWLVFHNCGIA